MDKDILNYRKEHPSCKWCKHCHYKHKLEFFWQECELSGKWQYEWLNSIVARFCKYYKVKENDNNNEV